MKRSDEKRGCLSQESLGDLAIRIAQSAGDPGAPGEGSPEYLSVDLFKPDWEEMRRHLESCPVCRKKLVEEIYSVRRYLDGLENPENIKRFDEIMEKLGDSTDSGEHGLEYIETILRFDAYGQGEVEIALAAASGPKDQQPMRFSSEDGTMILREFPETSSGQSRYQLISDDPGLASDAEVIIGEQIFHTTLEGLLILGESQVKITKDTVFRIRRTRTE